MQNMSEEIIQAAMAMLLDVPEVWTPIPKQSHVDEMAQGLLIGCGLVERKLHLRLRAPGQEKSVDIVFTFTGTAGLARAMEPGLAEAWALWGQNEELRKGTYVEWGDDTNEWRLTDKGKEARSEVERDDTRYLYDFLRTPAVSGAENLPGLRFVPGQYRPAVTGEGRALSVKVVNNSEPLSVRVENLSEISGPLMDIVAAIEKLKQMPAASPDAGAGEQKNDSGTSAEEVRKNMLDALEQKAKPRSMDKWAKEFGCSSSTVWKVIKRTPKLRALLNERTRTPRAQSLTKEVLDNAAAEVPDPAKAAESEETAEKSEQEQLEIALARLMNKASPEERAALNAMPKEKLDELCRQLIEQHKDDKRNKTLGRKP